MKLWRYNRSFETLGQRYQLLGALGSGGMADVCLAWDEHDRREVAIKVIKPDELDQRTLDRFVKEAAKVAQWHHPNILHIYSDLKLELVDPSRGSMIPYIVMEYAAGGDLHKRLRPGQPYPLKEILTLAPQLCSAVAYAHTQGVIHRDLKPLNILFRVLPNGSEQAVLSDFGLAVEVNATHHTFPSGGTLPYMAPEQFRGGTLPQSDIFALGVILYQLCTGRLPFRRTLFEVGRDLARQQQLTPPPRPSSLQPHLSPDLDAVILRALAHDPTQRYPDAETLWEDFHASAHSSRKSRSITPALYSHVDADSLPPNGSLSPNGGSVAPPSQSAHHSFIEDVVNEEVESSGKNLSITPPRRSHTGPGPVVSPSQPARRSRSNMGNASIIPAHRTRPDPDIISITPSRHDNRKQPSITPRPATSVRGYPHAEASRTRGYFLLAALLIVLLVTGVIVSFPGLRGVPDPLAALLNGNHATITLTPSSHLEQHTYQVTGVPNAPDTTQSQVQARPLTASAQSNTQTIQGTGKKQTAGTKASGILTFSNGSFANTFVVNAGTQIAGNDGVLVTTDASVTVPTASTNGTLGVATIKAHTSNPGAKGNIQAMDINRTCCTTGNSIFVRNIDAFTGGQDAQNYTFVTQQDVDAVSGGLQNSAQAQALQQLRGMLQNGEELAGDPQCKNTINHTNPIGDTGTNIASTAISVTVSCNAFAYPRQQMQGLLAGKLQPLADSDLGSGSKLASPLQLHVLQQQPDGANVTWSIEAQGTWAYHFDATAQQTLARLVAGKTPVLAQTLLQNTHGVARADIQFNGATLPGDPNQITFTITNGSKLAP